MPNATKDNAGWQVTYTVDSASEKTITFQTENKFMDANARVTVTALPASNPVFMVNDASSNDLYGSTAIDGVYHPVATITGTATIETSGFIVADTYGFGWTGVKIGPVNQSTLKNGTTAINSGATINPTNASQTINISEGYNAARTIVVGPVSAGPKGTVTSGSATIDTLNYAYNTTNSNFTVSGLGDVSAPTVNTAGFVSSTAGTKNENTGGATVAASVPKIAIAASLSGTGTKAPSITKNSATNIAQAGNATTTQPSSGYYIAVSSAANTGTVQATASVTTAGYGTTTAGQYTTTPSSSLTVGAAASSVTYVPITEATFANAATSGTTYTDISSTGPILISGDYLYINPGYTTAKKISLARLVPDATDTNASAAYILAGYTAYDNSGTLITGTM